MDSSREEVAPHTKVLVKISILVTPFGMNGLPLKSPELTPCARPIR
jgi:hypothetical protein